MTEKVVVVDEGLSNAIKSRQIKMEALNEMIAFCLSTVSYVVPAEKVEMLKNDYFVLKEEYEVLKQELEQSIKAEMPDATLLSWNLDFDTHKVTAKVE